MNLLKRYLPAILSFLILATSCKNKVEVDPEWYNCQKWCNQSNGEINMLVNYSTNYCLIDNRAIALNFIYDYVPEINATKLLCCLSDITVGREEHGYREPLFNEEMTEINCLGDDKDYFRIPIYLNKGSYLCASLNKTEDIMRFFQEYDKILVEVSLSDGTQLTYTFNSRDGLIANHIQN